MERFKSFVIDSMKIVIINPPIRLSDRPRHIHHGLEILANIIRKKLNITPTFIDVNAHRYSEEQLRTILTCPLLAVTSIYALTDVVLQRRNIISFKRVQAFYNLKYVENPKKTKHFTL